MKNDTNQYFETTNGAYIGVVESRWTVGCTNINTRSKPPADFPWLAFALVAVVVLFFTHRWVYRLGVYNRRLAEKIENHNRG